MKTLGIVVEKGERLRLLKTSVGKAVEAVMAPYRSLIFNTRSAHRLPLGTQLSTAER